MGNLIRCKVCGLIIEDKKVKDICPACGVKRAAFEPYEETISEKRMRILRLHLHPIVVHFPQAFAVLIPGLIILNYILPVQWGSDLIPAVRVLSLLLPLSVLASLSTGLLDGRLRFNRLSTPFLKRKIAAASLLLIISAAIAMIILTLGLTGKTEPIIIALGIAGVLCEVYLGQIGIKLMFSIMKG